MTAAFRLAVISAIATLLVTGTAAALADAPTVSVWEPGGLTEETVATVTSFASRHGAGILLVHRGTVRMSAVVRGDVVVQRAPDGFAYPMSTMAIDPIAGRRVLPSVVLEELAAGRVVMGETSAGLRDAQAGDVITFTGWDGAEHRLPLGLIVPDEHVIGAELAVSESTAATFGFARPSSMVLSGFESEARLTAELAAAFGSRRVGVAGSSDPVDPDSVMPAASLKQRFGEFAYRPTGRGDQIDIEPDWVAEHIVEVDLPLLGRFKCHRLAVPYVAAAVDEVIAAGLSGHIDGRDFQVVGGCFNPRMIRGGDKGGAISRHAWGVAVDINPSTNPYGGAVTMDRRIVEIFHRWGFAWGGGWTYPDGGHFEWTRRPLHVIAA